jgi:Heavy metal binding domain
MSFIQQFQNISGAVPISRRRALIGLSLLTLTACSRLVQPRISVADDKIAYYTCTMHPFVRSKDPQGKCPVCGMNLVPVLKSSTSASASPIAFISPDRLKAIGANEEAVSVNPAAGSLSVPVSAVLPTGSKFIVFIDHRNGEVEPREIEIGTQTATSCEVISGLQKEDRVFVTAIFLLDAECRIQGVLKTWGDRP